MFAESVVKKEYERIDQERLQRNLDRSQWLAVGLFLIVLVSYAVQFVLLPYAIENWGYPKNWTIGIGSQEIWGQFGDYLGGFLNPFVAAFALYWLTQSVRLQSVEMAATRRALEESVKTQREQMVLAQLQAKDQSQQARFTARINTLNVLVASFTADIASVRENLNIVTQPYRDGTHRYFNLSGVSINTGQANALVAQLNAELQRLVDERQKFLDELKNLRS